MNYESEKAKSEAKNIFYTYIQLEAIEIRKKGVHVHLILMNLMFVFSRCLCFFLPFHHFIIHNGHNYNKYTGDIQ